MIFKVKEVERTYLIDGRQLLKVLAACDLSQSQLARECGYLSPSRVSAIIKRGKVRIGQKALRKILTSLRKRKVKIEGFAWKT